MQITKIVCMLGVLLLNANANGMTHEHLEPEYISFTEEEAYVLNTCNHNYFPTSTDTIKAQTNYPISTIKNENMRIFLSSFDRIQRDAHKRTGITSATFKGFYNIALALLCLGYDVNERLKGQRITKNNETHLFQIAALVEAVQHKRINFVQLFLQWGADPRLFIKDDHFNLLLFLAERNNDDEILTLLQQAMKSLQERPAYFEATQDPHQQYQRPSRWCHNPYSYAENKLPAE